MKYIVPAAFAMASVLLLGCADSTKTPPQTAHQRIVTVGAAITETVYALGMEQHLVGRDQTSLWPHAASDLPNVGYPRALALEGILSLTPDLLVVSHDAGPPHVISGLKNAGVNVLTVTTGPDWEHAKAGIRQIGVQLEREVQAMAILAHADQGIGRVAEVPSSAGGEHSRLLFLLAEGPSGWLAAGADTRADTLINAVQGVNVMAASSGYRPLSAEAILALSPDAILVASHALVDQHSGAAKPLQDTLIDAGLDVVPAVKNGRTFALDSGKFLTLGPRFGEAVSELSALLEPKAVAVSD
jgi:iron complex transport system substrate-binding protein